MLVLFNPFRVWKKDGLSVKRKKGEKKKIMMIKKLSHFSLSSFKLLHMLK
jgi:hypothetical protein